MAFRYGTGGQKAEESMLWKELIEEKKRKQTRAEVAIEYLRRISPKGQHGSMNWLFKSLPAATLAPLGRYRGRQALMIW